jgi:hypothetical protein
MGYSYHMADVSAAKRIEHKELRDYFAAKAMQANLTTIKDFSSDQWRVELAYDSYLMADAMLIARNINE